MALKLLVPGIQPIGVFDGLDSEATTLYGGEIVTLRSIAATVATDKAAADVYRGFVYGSKRVCVTRNIGTTDGYRPLMLADDGLTGYGTLFGSVVGGTVGMVSTGGTSLGPHTTTGSGKVTCWDKPGLYAVSLDAACDQAADGLVPTNATLNTGSQLTFVPSSSTVGGQLTPVGSTAAAGNTVVVAHFVEFETSGSLVTTPNYLVSSLTPTYTFAVFHFNPTI